MPTYEYACKDCGQHMDVVQSFHDDALTVCPSCQGRLRKVFSAAGIIFKGSGWHIKDYANNSSATTASKKADTAGASGDGGGESGDSSTTDSSSSTSSSSSSSDSSPAEARSA